ncbi:MAG: hypothetical protein ACTHLE_01990 [Agriterribacter sp.]
MNTFITILKIASAILFLFLLNPGDKITIPMWVTILLGLIFPYDVAATAFSIAAIIFLITIIIVAYWHTLSHDRLSLFLLLALYIPVARNISDVFESNDIASIRSYLIFLSVSLLTIALIAIRMIQNKYTDQRSITKPFRKWLLRTLTEAESPRD